MTISAQNICRVWIIFRYLSYLMRLSACILQNLKDRAAVTFSYVMRPTGWKMIRHWQIRFVSLLMSFTHTIHLHLGFLSDFVLLKPLKCIMCRLWLPFLVHGASSCPVPQCRYFLVSPTPTYHRKKGITCLSWNNWLEICCTQCFLVLQNDLEEFFSMVNFTNPGVLGDASYFRRYYEVSMELDMNQAVLPNYKLQLFIQRQSVLSCMLRGIFRGTWKTWSELLFSTFISCGPMVTSLCLPWYHLSLNEGTNHLWERTHCKCRRKEIGIWEICRA